MSLSMRDQAVYDAILGGANTCELVSELVGFPAKGNIVRLYNLGLVHKGPRLPGKTTRRWLA